MDALFITNRFEEDKSWTGCNTFLYDLDILLLNLVSTINLCQENVVMGN